MADDVIHSSGYYIKYINRAILANLQRRPLKLGRLIFLLTQASCLCFKMASKEKMENIENRVYSSSCK